MPARDRDRFKHLVHRWTNGADFAALVWILHQMIDRSGSIEGFFAEGLADDAVDVGEALQSFSTRALALDVAAVYGRKRPKPGVAYFFSRPSSGGACKRLNLFLRWMVREDRVDLGVWKRVRPGQLIVPLDTHIIRVGQCLRLTEAQEPRLAHGGRHHRILAGHRSASIPIKFDFSICHLGMMNACGFGKKTGDARCPLKGACHSPAEQERALQDSVRHRDEPLYFPGRGAPWPPPDRQAAHPFDHHHPGSGDRHRPGDDGIHLARRDGQWHAAVRGRRAIRAAERLRSRRRADRSRPGALPRLSRAASTFEHLGAVGSRPFTIAHARWPNGIGSRRPDHATLDAAAAGVANRGPRADSRRWRAWRGAGRADPRKLVEAPLRRRPGPHRAGRSRSAACLAPWSASCPTRSSSRPPARSGSRSTN